LGEDPVHPRPDTELELLPGLSARQRAHAGSYNVAVGEHDLHAAVGVEVVAIERHRVAAAVVERVADDAAPSRIGHVDPELVTPFLDVTAQVEIADARLDETRRISLADVQNPVHALEIEHDAAGIRGRRASVSQISAGRDRIDRDLELIRDFDDLLYLFYAVGRDRSRSHPLFRFAPQRRVCVSIEIEVLVAGEHPLLPDRAFKLGNGVRVASFAHAGWDSHGDLFFSLVLTRAQPDR
jgi:hypothetical protein